MCSCCWPITSDGGVAGQFGRATSHRQASNGTSAAGRILSRRAVRRRGKTGSPHGFGDPRSSVSCAAVMLRARFTPLRACHGAHRRASQNAPCGTCAEPTSHSANSYGQRETCCGSEPCERRGARARRENPSQGRTPDRSRISTPPRRRARWDPGLAGSLPLIPEKGFPAPSSGSPSSMSPAAHHESGRDNRTDEHNL